MTEREKIELYKKDIELFLGTMKIFKGNKIVNTDKYKNELNKKFILDKMSELYAGNFDDKLLEIAVDELLPYLADFGSDREF